MRSSKHRWILFTAMLLLAGLVFTGLMKSSSQLSWQSVRWVVVVVALLAAIAQEFTNPWLAELTLRSVGEKCSYWHLLGIVTATAASNSAIPLPAGVPLRVWLQQRWLGVSYRKSVLATLIESLVTYGVLALAALFSLLCFAPTILANMGRQTPWLALCCFLAIAAVCIFVAHRLARRFVPTLKQVRVLDYLASIRWLPLGGAILITTLGIGLAYLRVRWLGTALSISTTQGGLIFTGLVISRLVGVLSMIPMGIGTRDISLGYFLVLAGASPDEATAWAALDRIVMTIPYAAIGMISIPWLQRAEQRGIAARNP